MKYCLSLLCLLLIAPACMGVYVCSEPSCQNCNITEPEDIKRNFEAIVSKIFMMFSAADSNGDGGVDADEFVTEFCGIDDDEACPDARRDLLHKIYNAQIFGATGTDLAKVLPYLLTLCNNPEQYDHSFESFMSAIYHYSDYNRDGVVELGVGDKLEYCDHHLQYRKFDWAKFTQCMHLIEEQMKIYDCDGNGVLTLPELLIIVQSGVQYKA